MTTRSLFGRFSVPHSWCRLGVLALAMPWILAGGLLAADDKAKVVGKCVTPTGSVILRNEQTKKWRPMRKGDGVPADHLLVGLPGAMLESKDGAVQLSLLADLDGHSPFPILESAVKLHDTSAVDIDFTLDRGRVDLTNKKAKGAAHARVHFRDETWDLTLAEPGTRVAMEIFGRWPRGMNFKAKNNDPKHVPTSALVLLVLKGEVEVKHGTHKHAMHAPPGPAIFRWDSVVGEEAGPERLDKLPDWADPRIKPSDLAAKKKAVLDKVREKLAKDDTPLGAYVTSDDLALRRVGVVSMGAVDNISGLIDALGNAKHADVRDAAVLTLRHWIGRCPGQDEKLYQLLIEEKKYSPAHAHCVLQLLHSFGDADLARPETYETLIAYLRHDKLTVRELAQWHLHRLVPAGKDIDYNPAGTKQEIEAGYQKWKALVPEGKLPPRVSDGKK